MLWRRENSAFGFLSIHHRLLLLFFEFMVWYVSNHQYDELMMMICVVASLVIEQVQVHLMTGIDSMMVGFVVERTFERHLMQHIEKQHELVASYYLIVELHRRLDQRLKIRHIIFYRRLRHVNSQMLKVKSLKDIQPSLKRQPGKNMILSPKKIFRIKLA